MKIKYVSYTFPEGKKEYTPWNRMTFYDCRVVNIQTSGYKAGKRMSIEIEAPKLRKKYYLYAWSDEGIYAAIEKSGLKEGDLISCHTELSYYQNKDGRHCEAFKVVANDAYDSKIPENELYFKFMIIKRESNTSSQAKKSSYLSKNDILQKMI